VIAPLAGAAVVAEAGLEGGAVKGLDRGAVGRGERDVDVLGCRVVADEREWPWGSGDVKAVGAAVLDPQADHGRDCLVEATRGVEVADADPEVVDPVLAAACLAVMDGLDAVPIGIAKRCLLYHLTLPTILLV
jgi:hypothetical protein